MRFIVSYGSQFSVDFRHGPSAEPTQPELPAALPSAGRAAGAHVPQTVGFRGRQGLQGPAKRRAVEPRPRRSPKGRARTGSSEAPANGRLPATSDIVQTGPQRLKRSDSWPADPSPAPQSVRQDVFWATLASRPRTKQRTRKPMSWARPVARQFTRNTGRAPRALGQSSHD